MRSFTYLEDGSAMLDALMIKEDSLSSARRYYMICCFCFGSFEHYRGVLTSSQRFWNVPDLFRCFRDMLDLDEHHWAVPERNGNEGSVVFALRECSTERIQAIRERLMRWGTGLYPLFTLCTGEPFRRLDELSESYARTYLVLKQKLVFGRSSCVRASEDSPSLTSSSWESERAIFLLANNGSTDQLFGELQALLRKAEAFDWTQLQLEHAIKQFLFAIVQALGPAVIDVEKTVHDAVGSQTSYAGLQSTLIEFIAAQFGLDGKLEELDRRLLQLHRYLEEHYAESVSLGAMADMLQMSRSSLTRLYKKMFEVAPMEHVIQMRMAKAQEMIVERPELQIREISQIVGYEDPYYFSRMFKIYTGLNPSAYRGQQDGMKKYLSK